MGLLVSGAALGYTTSQQYINQEQNARMALQRQSEARLGENPARVTGYPDSSYIFSNRGVLVQKGREDNTDSLLVFQFNPETITDVKSVNMSSKSYLGFNHVDYIWSSGGERVISFKLNFEATAGANNPVFGGENSYGNIDYDNLDKKFPRGTLDYVEKLQAFQYPRNPDPTKPVFTNGGHVPTPKFMPPPIVIFAYGNYYLEGIIAEVSTTHTLFNGRLFPVRSECDVQFKVLEQMQVQVKNLLSNRSAIGGGDDAVRQAELPPSSGIDDLNFA